ncbi:MAG TPA: class I SAM-dependent methyltransferase [Geminicoccus sp.]|jgi:SAM-dependent methyltransferase|uniref:class I SAM-dependent methyltransferase n=1 Tax=Geminicoccus sp. TaxID=2024832 RepID=UPI002E30429E|nr:class I SAM-dependent methyltransferase [Geminicoccus sp.]HEX2525812.1 class I SAM-dependent methyltransferase [Geminicoccus sp.]
MTRPFKDHFSTNSAGYAAHRPTYPAALVQFLADVAPDRHLALDCGCGTGQLSVLLAERFDRVVATDASAEQIAHADAHPRVAYRLVPAERSGMQAGTVDLVTVAQAAHWFDLPAFYAEVRRVTYPGSILALISYGVLHVDEPQVEPLLQHFYWDALGPYWPSERRHVEEGYRSLPFPFAVIEAPMLDIQVQWTLGDLLGYVGTWSAVRRLEKAAGQGSIDDFTRKLAGAWGDPQACRTVRWPLALRVGRVEDQAAAD